MTHASENIQSLRFLNVRFAEYLLQGKVTSVCLTHMCDRDEYTKEELLEAYKEQINLVEDYEKDFRSNHVFYEANEQLASFDNDEFVCELVEYIISEEQR